MSRVNAFDEWREVMRTLLSSRESLSDWQDQRFALAHQIGGLLSGRFGYGEPIDARVLYGVYVAGLGVVYVGQTGDAIRRLYDLAIGESHHLAATVPPELWERVVVIEWRTLLAEITDAEQAVIHGLGTETTSLALEILFQRELDPPINSRRRSADGTWRARQPSNRASRGALAAPLIPELFNVAREAWQALAMVETPAEDSIIRSHRGRVVFPQNL